MAIFDPAPDVRPKSARSSVDHERLSHRVAVSRPPSIETINSANSVPFAPPPPPPPSAWKQFTNRFSRRVIKRHVKFIVALYISSALALITPVAHQLGPTPYLANVAVVFMHPSRTVGSQLEVTFFSVIGGILGAIWIIPCQVAVAAFNQRYLADGNKSAWAIEAAWFFLGVWVMTLYKTRYAKLNCTFIIYTIAGIFSLTRSQATLHFTFLNFWNLMGPLMIGIAICLFVSIVFWPETASEGLGRALNESMDTSRSLLNLSTRAFLLNHKTIALPKSAIDKAQAEVRTAQKKLFSAYREARYEVTYSRTNPADYKEVKTIVSALMRHLASMSLVVQNERLLMLGHPDRDDEDLMTQSGGESDTSFATSNSSESESDSDTESHGRRRDRPSRSNSNTNSGEQISQQADYFGNATTESVTGKGHRTRNRRQKKSDTVESPTSEDDNDEPHHRRVRRRGSAAELRRIRQLLQRAENSTQAALKAKQQQQENAKKENLQQTFQFDRGGFATAPSTPSGRGVFNVFGYHQAHRSRNRSPEQQTGLGTSETLQPSSGHPSNATTPNSSRPNSIYEETNLDTVKSFKSLFSIKSASMFKSNRPSSLKAGFKPGNFMWGRGRGDQGDEHSAGTPLDFHYATMPAGSFPEDDHLNNRHYRTIGGIRFGTSLTDQQVRKAAEAYRKKQEKQIKRERKQAERERKVEEQRIEKQEQAVAAARAIPPKEVAFGDRKLFMSFLDIVRDPLQRLSDSCSRVMVALEMELVSGLNVEQDRLERIQRRNVQREAAIRAAEAKKAGDEKAATNGATVNTNATRTEATACEAPKEAADTRLTALDRFRVLVGVKPHKLSKEDLDYAEALKSSMGLRIQVGDKGKKGKDSKSAKTVHPNKFLQQDTIRKMTSSGLEEEDDFALPPGMSYVQYLTQELEVFDKAEAQGLQDFIATHPSLDVGPREEIFLIFFFLFALREIARELLRLGKYVEELEEQERRIMELEGRNKRKKKLWWPKVFGNFWHWFAWGSYSQVKTSEGYNSLIRNSAKNLEHRQPKTIEEEKAIVEAKAAKAAADKLAAEVAAEAAADKREELQRRVAQPWAPIPLRRTVTLSNLIHRRGQGVDLEQGRDGTRNPRGQEKSSQERRSRSNTRLRTGNEWTSDRPRRYRSHQRLFSNSRLRHGVVETTQQPDMGNPYVLGNSEDLQLSPEEEKVEASEKSESERAGQYSVVEIPSFGSLRHKQKEDLRRFDDTNQVELLPKIHVLKPSHTAPPELDINKLFKARKSPFSSDSDAGEGPSVLPSSSAMSPGHQFPSFSLRTSPALLSDHHSSSDSVAKTSRKEGPYTVDFDSTDSDSEHQAGKKDNKSSARNLFSGFSRRHSSEDVESETSPPSRKKSPSPAPAPPEPPQQPRTIFVNIPKPKTWRYWFWNHLQPFKSEEFKFGFKMACALSFIGLWSWLQWNSTPLATDRGQWAMMTVMAVLSPTVGATFSVCAMRVAGTLAGTLWALITYLVLPQNPWVICAFMLVIGFASVFLILESAHPKLGIIMMLSYSSVTFIKYEGNTAETIYEVCYKRSITVIIGIIISVVMNSLLWPILARRELRKEIAVLIGRQGVLFAELVNKFFLEEQREGQGLSHYVANWPENVQDDDDDDDDDGKLDEKAALARSLEAEHVHDSFVERAEQAARASHQFSSNQDGRGKGSTAMRSRSEGQISTSQASEATGAGGRVTSYNAELLHQATPKSADPDRLAFQHVEQQLQTKLLKINQLLELSASEPRLKEQFPMKLYKQIIQCCQNILDRMVSMRMAAQLISPEVRELVTGPMNYYRRDMVGALLLYFSVLSSSLASKSPLPPYLPSARVARLRVIYNVREAIAAHQAVTNEDHYTYIYYYAFSSALEEVIEELELLAILIKPIVGVTLVSSGNRTYDGTGGFTGDEFNFGTAVQTNYIGIPDTSTLSHPAPGSEALHGQGLGVGRGIGGSLMQDSSSAGSSTAMPVMMINIGTSDSTTAGMGAGAFGQAHQHLPQHHLQRQQQQQHQRQRDLEKGYEPQELEYPHDLLHQQQQKLMQDQVKMQQMQQQIEAQQKTIQQQQVQIEQQQKAYNFHPDLAITAPIARAPSSTSNPTGNLAGGSGSKSSLLSGHSVAGSIGQGGGKDKRPSVIESEILSSASTAASALHQHSSRRKSTTVKPRAGGLHVNIPSTPSVPQAGGLAPNTAATLGGMKLPPAAVALATSPIIMMDESLLGGGRHSQRFKEAFQVAQEASGQKVIEVRSPTISTCGVMVIPAQVQLPMGTTSTGSTTKKAGAGSSSNVPTLKKILSAGGATASSIASPGAVVASPKVKTTNAGLLAASHSSHLPDVTATLPGPQQQSQPHQQQMQRPSVHLFASQKGQGSVSGHGHFGSLAASSAGPSLANGGEGPSSASISTSTAAPFVLSLPARVIVPTTTATTTSPTTPPSS
ncbi:hypothetical protein BGZ47_009242 [Haplosporangium gracile]|nr:hypothetical protein BGZ47_009242 [Haplosporangium gracile]